MTARRAQRDTVLAFGGNIFGAGKENVYIPAVAAGDEEQNVVLVADQDIEITRVVWIPKDDHTGDNSNQASLRVVNIGDEGAGEGDVDVTDKKAYAEDTDSAAGVPEELTLSSADDATLVSKDEVVVFEKENEEGTKAVGEGLLQVSWVSQRA